MLVGNPLLGCAALVVAACATSLFGQAVPATAGETLSGRRIVLADDLRGHAALLVAGFSRQGGNATAAWVNAIHSDSALAGVAVYQVAMLAGAPGLIRAMIKKSMKKDVPPAEQERFIVLAEDEKAWRNYFAVGDDQVPYVSVVDSAGNRLWRGHGSSPDLKPLESALKSKEK